MLEELFNSISTLSIIKIVILIVDGIYIAFLLVVYKQARAMQAVINDNGASTLINFLALVNIVIGILIFVAALVIL